MRVDDPESYAYWSERKIGEMQRKQKKLLYSAVQALRPGGSLVYSTCSFAPEENELVVNHVLKKFNGELEILPMDIQQVPVMAGLKAWGKKTLHPDLRHAARILPDGTMDGFFLCQLRKS